MSPLRRSGLIEDWHDRKICPGADFDTEISTFLEAADLILLLISPDFIASDYCYKNEMNRALERHAAGDARVLPIIMRPVDWHSSPFGRLLAVPIDGKPVTSWAKRDEALLNVTQAIRSIVEELQGRRW